VVESWTWYVSKALTVGPFLSAYRLVTLQAKSISASAVFARHLGFALFTPHKPAPKEQILFLFILSSHGQLHAVIMYLA
jgi:hypothetical protein